MPYLKIFYLRFTASAIVMFAFNSVRHIIQDVNYIFKKEASETALAKRRKCPNLHHNHKVHHEEKQAEEGTVLFWKKCFL